MFSAAGTPLEAILRATSRDELYQRVCDAVVDEGGSIATAILAAAAGILYAGTIGAADPLSGLTFMLPGFAAAFLGATSITPGRFNPWGSLVAVYFLVIGITGLTILGIQTFVQNLFYGGGLVIAVALSQLVRKREAQDFT